MKKILYKLLVFIPVILIYNLSLSIDNCVAQWEPTNGPGGGDFRSMTASGSNLFVGTSNAGIFKTTNNGISWNAVNNGLPGGTDALVSNQTNIFAHTGGGVFRTTNNGLIWTQILQNQQAHAIASNNNYLFVGVSGSGIFRSTNNGDIWTLCYSTNLIISSILIKDNRVFAGTNDNGVLRSTNNGDSWTYFSLGNLSVNILASNNTYLFATGYDGTANGVYRSSDFGNSWIKIMTNQYVLCLSVSGMNIFTGGASGVYRSTNNGDNWVVVNTGIEMQYINSMAVLGSNIFV